MQRISLSVATFAAALLLVAGAQPGAANERTVGTIVGAGLGGAVGGVRGAVVGGVAGNLVGAVVKNERKKSRAAAAPASSTGDSAPAAGAAAASDPATVEPPIEDVVAEAAPVLHHTCRTIVDAHPDDNAAIDADIRKMVALSVANRGIDLSNPPLSDETREEIRAEFADELGDRCARDDDAALFGVVDGVVADLARLYR